MRFGAIKPFVEAPYMSDKLAILLSERQYHLHVFNKMCNVRSGHIHNIFEPPMQSGSTAQAIADNQPLVEPIFSEGFDYNTRADLTGLDKQLNIVKGIEERLVTLSEAEVQERKRLLDQQTFSSSFIEGKLGVYVDEEQGEHWLSVVDINNKAGVGCILHCVDESLLTVIKWIQAMLQLTGDDRFSTYQQSSAYYNTWDMSGAELVDIAFSNERASVVVTGKLEYKTTGMLYEQKINSIVFRERDGGLRSFTLSDLVRLGSTKAATLIRI